MLKTLAVLALFAAAAVPAHAVDLGIRQGFGSNSYDGTDVWATLPVGADITVRPEYQQFSSTATGGTFRTYRLRAAKDTNIYGIGLNAGVTPVESGYKNVFGGADVRFSLSNTGGGGFSAITTSGSTGPGRSGTGLARVDVGAGVQYTKHTNDTTGDDLAETDVNLSAGAKFLGINLSGTWTKASYNKDITAANSFAILRLPGIETAFFGLPDQSLTLRADLPLLPIPLVTPFVTYAHTSYKSATGTTNIYGGGVYVDLDMLQLYGKIELLHPNDLPAPLDSNSTYVTVGASLRFGLGA